MQLDCWRHTAIPFKLAEPRRIEVAMSTTSKTSDAADESRLKRGEFKLKCIETGAKIVGAVVVVGTLLLAYGDYVSTRDRERKQREQQFKLQLYEQQIELYQKWVGIASQIAFAENVNRKEVDVLLKQFNELFWGELSVLKDDTIVRAGNNFNAQLANRKNGTATKDELKRTLHRLGQSCRKSLSCSVGIELASHTEGGGKTYRCGEYEKWEAMIPFKTPSADDPSGKGEFEPPDPQK